MTVTALPLPPAAHPPTARDDALDGPRGHDWVLAAPFRAHVRRLMAADALPWRVVAGLAGVPDGVVRTLVVGRAGRLRPRMPARHARALLAFDRHTVAAARSAAVSARPTTRAVRILLATGHPLSEVAAMLDLTARRTHALATGAQQTTSVLVEVYALAACRAHGIDLAEQDADRAYAAATAPAAA